MALKLDTSAADFPHQFDAYVSRARGAAEDVSETVKTIIADVRAQGFSAVAEYTKRFDRFDLTADAVRVSSAEIDAAIGACDHETIAALEFASARIRAFHQRQIPEDVFYTDDAGVDLGWRWTPVAAAGLYAPGGAAAYPSSVLMNAIPAKIAGVDRLAMVTPTPDGVINPAVLAAASIAGVDEIYRLGGAQAIAALAYGATPVSPVDVIVGPGNVFVAEAKRQVFGIVGIDSVAGPSEILVVADGENDPACIAADLLSQAEHDASSQSILITDDREFARYVEAEASTQLAQSSRRTTAEAAWRDNGAIIVVETLSEAPALIDRIAPEHLELAIEDPEQFSRGVRNAGAIFLGRHTPEALGDYVAGPNHVLPTSGGARHASGLSVLSFMKRTTLVGCDEAGVRAIGPAAARLADAEGLPAHAHSVRLRLR